MELMIEGNRQAKVVILKDFLDVHEQAEKSVILGPKRELLVGSLARAGLTQHDVCFICLFPFYPKYGKHESINKEIKIKQVESLKKILKSMKPNLIVPLGSQLLEILTGEKSIHKWHLSILRARAEFGTLKVLPLFDPSEVLRSYQDSFYISYGAMKIAEEAKTSKITIPNRTFHLSPSFEDTVDYLNHTIKHAKRISLDVETGKGIINTVGYATSPTEAIAMRVDPYSFGSEKTKEHHQVWLKIKELMESDIPKIAQNFLYDIQYLSKYGIYVNNIHHDTMWAMKFLHPEMRAGLDNVGRIYTPFPYWKEDGKDWGNIANWVEHLKYNCKDTTGTMWAYHEQKKDLEERGLSDTFYGFVMKFAEPIREMCTRGLPLDPNRLQTLKDNLNYEIKHLMQDLDEITEERIGMKINPKSPKQLKDAFSAMNLKIPIQKGQESTDKKALVKMKKRYKKEKILDILLKLSAANKQLSSYINFSYDTDNRVRFSLNGCGTETGRWSGHKDPWGKGFNPQTVPKKIRSLFVSEPGKILIQVDLAQAESRYVAYEAPEPTLMRMLENGEDVHKYVASKIFNKDESMINYKERQLGKRSGHGANYAIGPRTFAESCLVEMGLSITETEAKRILDTYYQVFPGIKRRQQNIQDEIRRTKKLKTPLGRERYFYDRIGDSLFREAYAYAPQSTIPDITNYLMLHLRGHCELLLQVHDSVLIQVRESRAKEIIELASDLDSWHPEIHLPGGQLRIPIDIEIGHSWGDMDSI